MGNLVTGFNPNQNYQWAFVTAAGGIQNFSADKFFISTADLMNDFTGGSFSVAENGNSLVLGFSAVP
ncbi:MAG: hypothetical protein Q8M16_16505 [Pirellulaceae bacterium]|nr:hypothetical protein [Pirellulaceae bacterium]